MSERTRKAGAVARFAGELQQQVVVFSICWLAAANLVGVWLAVLLVRPAWGAFLGEWTYGRWMALHLNWQLYGWCSLPLAGLLFKRFLTPHPRGLQQAKWVLSLWSLALVLGGVSWLQGQTSGKLFLEWAGAPRLILALTLVCLWGVLAWHFRHHGVPTAAAENRALRRRRLVDQTILGTLALVPALLYWSAGPKVYPAIDPGTCGPTGASLLGSTLVIVLIMAMIPKLLGLSCHAEYPRTGFWGWFAFSSGIFLLARHGNSSHRQWGQVIALGSLLLWVPVLTRYLRRFAWTPPSRLWLQATLWWWAALVSSGFVSFLPGLLDRIKFTHALVAHAHLAMAGLLTSVNMLVLLNLSEPATPVASPLVNWSAFLCWHGGLLLQIIALFCLAKIEIDHPGQLFSGAGGKLYVARLCGGMLMAGASFYWMIAVTTRYPASGARLPPA